ncbi:reverse transcriptase [Necator americanus]|uniref:Reverse transcriptase n=1 Tax=Necator americanus TaxID=51031 RepID=W2SIN1_NECAM|nr:reverse transcriptase [Necator americanus]ETN68607.1 reverse transcriptase [Necator americanus]
MWSSTSSVIRLTAENTLGKTTVGKPKAQKATWFWNEEVQAVIREKKSKYKLWWRTHQPEDRDAYLAAKREAKKAVSKAKSDRYKAVYDMLDTREGEWAGAGGAVLRRSGQILERWREYYNHLCNEEFCHPPIPTVPNVESPVLPITAVEVSAALAKMKSNKATGPDDIPADVWKLLGDRGSMWLATLFNKIVAEGRTPDVWQTSVTVPVWKGKGDIADCTLYRPIRLLCHTMKVFERVLEARLREIVSVSLNQCGFVKDCSTVDAIHAVRILLEKHREKNRSVHLAFLDLEKAFDRVPHELLWMSMRSHRVPEEYVRWTKLLYTKPTSVVRCAAGTSRPFPVQVGVHQGSSLSPLLFILCMDTITKEIQKQHPWTLLFADDVMLASESRDDLQEQVQSWKDQLQQYGLRFNTSKIEYMECGPRIEVGSIRVDGTELNKRISKSTSRGTPNVGEEGRNASPNAKANELLECGILHHYTHT